MSLLRLILAALALAVVLGCARAAEVKVLNLAASRPVERDILLGFKARISNWEAVQAARGLRGWSQCPDPDCLLVCSWGGVQCDARNHVYKLELGCHSAQGCPGGVPLRGTLGPGLEVLESLQTLDLGTNALSGSLPPQWGLNGTFPALQLLNLESNNISGRIPEEWAYGGGFQEVVEFDVSRNQLTGPFPSVAYTNTSFMRMQSFNIGNNRMSGPLPSFWNGLIILTVVNIESNLFTGTVPPDWGTQGYWFNGSYNETQALEYLYLGGNQLTGGLPGGWAANGSFAALKVASLAGNPLGGPLPRAWGDAEYSLPALQSLNVSSIGLTGTLPAEWGAGLASLKELDLANNRLQGGIPASWNELSALQRVYVQPGNAQLCPLPPSQAGFNLCKEGEVLCLDTLPYDPGHCPVPPPPPPYDGSGSSFPVAPVVAPVAAVGVAALAAGGYCWWRRRRRAAASMQRQPSVKKESEQARATLDGDGLLDGDAWGCAGGVAGGGPTGTLGQLSPFATAPTPPDASTPDIERRASSELQQQQQQQRKYSSDRTSFTCVPCFRSTSLQLERERGNVQSLPPPEPQKSAPLWLPQPRSGSNLPRQGSAGSATSSSSGGTCGGLVHGWGPLPAHGPSGSGRHAARDRRHMESLLSEWQIPPETIEFMKRPDGSLWQLGSGGFGTVFKALRNGVTTVAVKVLGATVENAQKLMMDDDFYREIAILRACRDTNILQFQGACFKDDRALLVTEYMEGGSLTANLKAGTVTWYRRGKKVATDVARALVYLHSRRIVHLDIKSANVLLTRDGTAKVGDVGMAKILPESNYVSGGGNVGTLAWSAPELLLGRRCDGKADIYSFGVVLWEIATGELPVRGQLREPIVPDECPQEVLILLQRCLDPDPSARPTATELAQQLQAATATPPAGSAASLAAVGRRSSSTASSHEGRPPLSRAATTMGSLGLGSAPSAGSYPTPAPTPTPTRATSIALPLPPQPPPLALPLPPGRHSDDWIAMAMATAALAGDHEGGGVETPEGTLGGELRPLRPSLETLAPASGPHMAGSGAAAAAGDGGAALAGTAAPAPMPAGGPAD